eukprot:4695541-Pyramimonas_sp.AAC.1
MGRKVQNDVRRHGALRQEAISWLQDKYPDPGAELQDKDYGPFRTACGKYGVATATAARSLIQFMRDRRRNNPYHDGEAEFVGPRAPAGTKDRPLSRPPPLRPGVSDVRVSEEAAESPRSVAGSAVTTRETYLLHPSVRDRSDSLRARDGAMDAARGAAVDAASGAAMDAASSAADNSYEYDPPMSYPRYVNKIHA